jgi:uncharacterized membrane protein YwaF
MTGFSVLVVSLKVWYTTVMTRQLVNRPKRHTNLPENIGKVCINLGQMVFGTLFLGGVLRGEVPQYLMVLSGIISALILITIGLFLSAKEKQDEE